MSSDKEFVQVDVGFQDEVMFRDIVALLWKKKITLIVGVAIASLASVVLALSLPNKYKSSALLAPKANSGSGGLSGLASQYGGVARLAGINLGGIQANDPSAIAVEMLKSREFFRKYIYEFALVDLMAAEGWDRFTRETVLDEQKYNTEKQIWIRDTRNPSENVKPSVQESYDIFRRECLEVREDEESGFVTVSITHYSPTVARDWVALIVEGINDAVREREVTEAKNSIAFLNDQRLNNKLVSLNDVFSDLIEEQTKTVMLANASKEYVFQVIEPPVEPELKSEPKRALICVLGALIGLVLSVLVVLFPQKIARDNN